MILRFQFQLSSSQNKFLTKCSPSSPHILISAVLWAFSIPLLSSYYPTHLFHNEHLPLFQDLLVITIVTSLPNFYLLLLPLSTKGFISIIFTPFTYSWVHLISTATLRFRKKCFALVLLVLFQGKHSVIPTFAFVLLWSFIHPVDSVSAPAMPDVPLQYFRL